MTDLSALGGMLRALQASTDLPARRAADPVGAVHAFDEPLDREVAAVFAAFLAFGRVAAFRPVVERLMAIARRHGGPRAWVTTPPAAWLDEVRPVQYRWNRGPDFALLAAALGSLLAGGGTLEDHLPREGGLPDALTALSRAVRDRAVVVAPTVGVAATRVGELPRSFRTLVPDAGEGSACKRWWMLLRWLIRPADGVDLGLWRSRRPSELVVPLDTHVHRLSRLVGLTSRADGSLRTALDVTRRLRELDPDDPVGFDFALAHLGIAGTCRGSFDADVCPACPLRAACVVGSAR